MCTFDEPLNVPYIRQEGSGATHYRNDCGPACIAMLLRYAGLPTPTVDELSAQTHLASNDVGLTCADLKVLAGRNGLALTVRNDLTLARIQTYIDTGDPVLMLISYGYIQKRQNQADILGHFVNVVGITPSGDIIVNDPDFYPPRENDGHFMIVPRVQFESAVRYSPAPFQGLV